MDLAVGRNNNIYAAIVIAGRLAGVFRSGDGGNNWTTLDVPFAANGGIHPGGQGSIHLSLAADPTNHNIVYVGGDRQNTPFPNAIGASDFSGILFRGDASRPLGSQFVPPDAFERPGTGRWRHGQPQLAARRLAGHGRRRQRSPHRGQRWRHLPADQPTEQHR